MTGYCMLCGAGHQLGIRPMKYECHCGGLLEVRLDYRTLDADKLKRLFHDRLGERHATYASGVWRYKEMIAPELPEACIVTRNEGNTGLYRPDNVRAYAGVRQLGLKAQSENPSGSFKDNGMTVAVSHGTMLGYRDFACSSTGNTSSSLAMYAATAGADSHVLVRNAG